jgi:hypothetical protein
MNHDKNCICMNMEERIKKDFFLLFIPYMAFHFFFPGEQGLSMVYSMYMFVRTYSNS